MSTVYQNASTSISDLQTKPHCSSHSNPCLTVQSSSSIICFIFKFGKNILSYLQTSPPTSPFPPNPFLHQGALEARNKARDAGGPAGCEMGLTGPVAGGESHMMGLGVASTTDPGIHRHQMAAYFRPYFQWLSTTSTGPRSQRSIPRPPAEGEISQKGSEPLAQRKPAGFKREDSLETTSGSLSCQLFGLTC